MGPKMMSTVFVKQIQSVVHDLPNIGVSDLFCISIRSVQERRVE